MKVEEMNIMEPSSYASLTKNTTKDLFEIPRIEIIKEIWHIVKSGMSVTVGILLITLFLTINLYFAGRIINPSIQAGIGLCNVVINCTGFSLIIGINQGFGSLSARAYSSKLYGLQKNYYTKGFFTTMVVCLIIFLFMLSLESLLVAVGQDPEVSLYAYRYGLGIIFGMICLFFFDLLRNLFNAMGIFNELLYIQFLSIICQYFLCEIFCSQLDMGLDGIILATNITYLSLLLMGIILAYKKQIDILPEFSFQAFSRNYKRYISFCLPIALPMVIDFFGFELNSFMIGSMKLPTQFSAHVIICNIVNLFYSIPIGLSGVLCTFTSNAVGENDHVKAKNYFKISYFPVLGYGLIFTLLLLGFKNEIGHFYSLNDEVVDNIIMVLKMYQFVIFLDFLQGIQQGILKGLGLGKICLQFFIISFYLVGTTSAFTLGIALDMQLIGFWIGLVLAIFSICTLLTIQLAKINWPQQIQLEHDHLLHDKRILDELIEQEKLIEQQGQQQL